MNEYKHVHAPLDNKCIHCGVDLPHYNMFAPGSGMNRRSEKDRRSVRSNCLVLDRRRRT